MPKNTFGVISLEGHGGKDQTAVVGYPNETVTNELAAESSNVLIGGQYEVVELIKLLAQQLDQQHLADLKAALDEREPALPYL